MARLIITAPDGKHGILELTKSVITIGRGTANDLVLNHARVSRFHAVIKQTAEGETMVADRGSTNGVFVNGTRVAADTTIKPGDHVRIGDYDLHYESVNEAALDIRRAEIPLTVNQLLKRPEPNSAESAAQQFKFARPPIQESQSSLNDLRQQMKKMERENYLLTVLYDAGRALHSKISIDDIATETMGLAFRIEGVERGFMMLFDEHGHVSRQTEVRYRSMPTSNEPQIILSRSVIERMKSEMAPIMITDLSADERFQGSESMKVSGLRSAMCAPLVAQKRLAGILYVDNLQKASAFTQEELNIFAVVATQAAAAIDSFIAHDALSKQILERSALERFLAPEVVEMIASNPQEIRLGGVNQKVSILFADVRGFTGLSETLPPEKVVEILNEYFTRVTDVIFDHGGTLDKYLGDGVMALFGAPISKGNDATNAVRAALSIQKLIEELNRDAADRNWPELRVGIGVNTGIVTAGNIGSPKRIDYTVIGDAVNVSSRLCNNAAAGQVLVSESTAMEVGGEFRLQQLAALQLKGKSKPMPVFSVLGLQNATGA
jgi:adenylate cyclase